jgi:nucleotide-binding universal stress UspA family protein
MKILVGYDGSKASKDALKLAQSHADICGAKLEIAKSVTRQRPLKPGDIEDAEILFEEEVRNVLKVRNFLNGSNVRYETHLLISSKSSGQNLVRFAELKKPDEIYVGARKRSRAGKFLLGSTTQYVVLHASCPVVSVK